MHPPHLLRLAILGGQGPLASAEFQLRLLRAFAHLEPAQAFGDAGFPQILHLSAALPGLGLSGVNASDAALEGLRQRLQLMQGWSPHLVAIPCNSLYEQALALQAEFGALPVLCPWLSAQTQMARDARPRLVLASRSLRAQLRRRGDPLVILPTQEEGALLDCVIEAAARGQLEHAQVLFDQELGARVSARAQRIPVLLACTELSLLPRVGTWAESAVDSMDLMVQDILKASHAAAFAPPTHTLASPHEALP